MIDKLGLVEIPEQYWDFFYCYDFEKLYLNKDNNKYYCSKEELKHFFSAIEAEIGVSYEDTF